jgi:hypothetical protein
MASFTDVASIKADASARMLYRANTLETEELRRLVQEGIDSGPSQEADAVFAMLKDRFSKLPTS